ncbi:CHC2 zinc finger domain-containing protein [Mucilaginibacter arboris]|uniref:Zinc finger CHC2-type domain-containing protein n=1 Tax=Mucilaginibacter arboris TaxID=2682090 RepID=A0A7K1T0C0_9SPHI|nr:CHC2 zinc finger domain-containing protein [Mucilaginibacter arboris]MVN23009.1 hypothetical protein [Mucilaginibacter arboris]
MGNNYSKLIAEASRIKEEIPILDYFFQLESKGALRYEGKKGKEHFFGFDNQKTGSISIRETTNLWYDHAIGDGGDIIKAVQKFENKSFVEAVQRLSINSDIVIDAYKSFLKKNGETNLEIEIIEVKNKVQHPALITYLKSRGLDIADIIDTAKEVHWSNGKDVFFAIGFNNLNGGYAVRSKVYKGNLKAGGICAYTIGGKPESIKLFEGSMDFASYRHIKPEESFYVVILNGTGNLTEKLCKKIDVKSISENLPVHLYFDCGREGVGGKHATKRGLQLIKGAEDKSAFYAEKGLNDVNDFLLFQQGSGDKRKI